MPDGMRGRPGGRPPGGRPPGGGFPGGGFPGMRPRRFPRFFFFPVFPPVYPPSGCYYIDRFGRCCDRNGWCCDQYGRCSYDEYAGGYSSEAATDYTAPEAEAASVPDMGTKDWM